MSSSGSRKKPRISEIGENAGNATSESLEILQKRAEEEQIAKLGGAVDVDLEYLLRTVQALIVTNREIKARIVEHTTCENEVGLFFRPSYGSTVSVKGRAVFSVPVKRTKRNFGQPPEVPSKISSVFTIDKIGAPNDLLPDYDGLFQRTLLLNKTVQGPFLSVIQDHLEAVQVYLGKIDGWIDEGVSSYEFLREIFGDAKRNSSSDKRGGVIPPNEVLFSNEASTFPHQSHGSFAFGSAHRNRPQQLDFAKLTTYKSPTRCDTTTVQLKSYPNEPGKYETSFDISGEHGREKLTKFLEYLSHNSSEG